MTAIIGRPDAGEYAPDFAEYIILVPGDDILTQLDRQLETTLSFFKNITEERSLYRYAPEKWSIRDVLGHLIDAERIMACRALRFARGDRTPVPGFEQDDYVRYGPFGHCRLVDLVGEFRSVRQVTWSLFRALDEAAWERRGVANKSEISVRALAYIIAGHELHHRRVLQERYFVANAPAAAKS